VNPLLNRGFTHARSRNFGLNDLPGSSAFVEVLNQALEGLLTLVHRAAEATLRRDAIVAAYTKQGHHGVADLVDIRKLDLHDVDQVRPRLDLHYTIAATTEGAAAGLVVSGGEILAAGGGLLGAGVGAAPGAGAVIGAIAVDTVSVLGSLTRLIAHTAAYYGYDTETPEERVFALGVLNFSMASQAGKAAAYVELSKIVNDLARRAVWKRLDENVVTRVVRVVYQALGQRLTQEKLAQAVPLIGIAIGAGLNARLVSTTATDANHLYRGRFLREKYNIPSDPRKSEDNADRVSPATAFDGDGSLPIVELLDEELAAGIPENTDPEGKSDDAGPAT
jgi:hypothetical protein